MNTLETILYPTQKELFNVIEKKYNTNAISHQNKFILVKGTAPILLVAHLDTVHKTPVQTICRSEDDNILMSPEGIGGDDRCGVYALLKIYETSKYKPWLLFTCDEEIGGYGAISFCNQYKQGKLPKELDTIKLIIEIDRTGSTDAVYYDCDVPELKQYISSKGFQTNFGSFSDISIIAPELGIAAVNLSSGYYNAHTLHEYINRNHLENTIQKVNEMIKESMNNNFPVYHYKEATNKMIHNIFNSQWYPGYSKNDWENWEENNYIENIEDYIPKGLTKEETQMYEKLLDLYSPEELEEYRDTFGNRMIKELYEESFKNELTY